MTRPHDPPDAARPRGRPRAARRGPRRGRQGRRRPGRRRLRAAGRPALRRPRADGGRARRRQDAAGAHPGRVRCRSRHRRVQFTPDLMPGDITGSMVIDSRQAGELTLPRGPGLHQPAAGRRDQPDAAQDPVGAAGGDGGGPGLGRRRLPTAARAVPRRRDPEPGRVRRHLPAARGPARPVPAQGGAADPRARPRSWRSCAGTPPASTRATSRRPGSPPVAGPADIAAGQARGAGPCRSRRRWPATSSTSPGPPASRRRCRLGVSPRGATALLRAARAWAWLTGRDFVTPDDVKALAHATLVHRLGLRPEAELEGVDVGRGARLGARLGPGPALSVA